MILVLVGEYFSRPCRTWSWNHGILRFERRILVFFWRFDKITSRTPVEPPRTRETDAKPSKRCDPGFESDIPKSWLDFTNSVRARNSVALKYDLKSSNRFKSLRNTPQKYSSERPLKDFSIGLVMFEQTGSNFVTFLSHDLSSPAPKPGSRIPDFVECDTAYLCCEIAASRNWAWLPWKAFAQDLFSNNIYIPPLTGEL